MNAKFVGEFPEPTELRGRFETAYRMDEQQAVQNLLRAADAGDAARGRIQARAKSLVEEIRRSTRGSEGLDAFLQEYELSNQEGVTLMCLAEALLRIPDAATADKLIKSKLMDADWEAHLGHSESLFVNASTWALMLTGRVIEMDRSILSAPTDYLGKLVAKSGEPFIRQAMVQAMKIMGRQFVMGRTIDEALDRAKHDEAQGYRHSYDMLGEAAYTDADALNYLESYSQAIKAVGTAAAGRGVVDAPGVSVKLSALFPRYELAQRRRVMDELLPRLMRLAKEAKEADIGLTIDAEEADRLDLSLDLLEAVSGDPSLVGWQGLGVVVQAYQKRAFSLIDWLQDMARRHDRRLMVRLVKGAYWDTEIKHAQELGLGGYPVFTRKASTDVSYLACARKLLAAPDAFYSQFATHNAHTLAAIMEFAGPAAYEFQRLHGMGEPLYDQIVGTDETAVPCRIYAPVGSHEELLAYLVRRLLENGANSSFVNRIVDETAPVEEIIADPIDTVRGYTSVPHPKIPLPRDMFGRERDNSRGIDLADKAELRRLSDVMNGAPNTPPTEPIGAKNGGLLLVHNPADPGETVGTIQTASAADVANAIDAADQAFIGWDATPADQRAGMLEKAADAMEAATPELMALCIREAGKTLADGIAEVREAVDFLRYYAVRARVDFSHPQDLPGPTGESNQISLHGRGPFVCISPWNFPLAIFTGQVAAALAAGNTVLAKPAEQTPLIAARAIDILHGAGVPKDVVQLLAGDGASVGAALVGDRRIAGVAFTGSTETARVINQTLAGRDGPIVPLIAETGGQNAMFVDSTALPEQVVSDVVMSAFQSAGQRCSALRVLFVQDEIADRVIDLLRGATAELRVGNPARLETDIGPVIDADALAMLEKHRQRMENDGRLLCRAPLGGDTGNGYYFAPCAYEIDDIGLLEREVFGPVLHVIRYRAENLEHVIHSLNATGYGLTLGVHSRVDTTQEQIHKMVRSGNTYVNRNIIGAVVGVQPFGGQGLSGTGPKAGGPRYLHRFAVERSRSINTTAAGGNAALMSMGA